MIGVLALQGGFAEHVAMLRSLNVEVREVRLPEDVLGLRGLIIPGGESTTIGRLLHQWQLFEPIIQAASQGLAIWGTCAGAILLAKTVTNLDVPGLALMDIKISRNAFGRQVDSFVEPLMIDALGEPAFPAVFIRAPVIESVGADVNVIARLSDGRIVAAESGRFLVTSFHPELTQDDRFHRYFLQRAFCL